MNFGDIMGLAMRLITHANEIQRIMPKVMEMFQTIDEIRTLLGKLFPETATTSRGRSMSDLPEPKYDVRWLQTSLNSLLGADLKVDGDYGERTKAAVKVYQRNSGLTVDGWAGLVTEAAILNALRRR
jgi:peptidoglycan hydrolase-like protein with peptidoglycan-binding domain